MNIDKTAIFSQCVYDGDNRYVDLHLRYALATNDCFILSMSDTSKDEEYDTVLELFLTKENLKIIIDRLTEVLENDERTN
jgi:hypothetical protein